MLALALRACAYAASKRSATPVQPCEQSVPKTSTERCLGGVRSGTHNQVERSEPSHQPWGQGRTVLTIGIEDQYELTTRESNAGLDGGTVALVIRVSHHSGARACGLAGRVVG